MRAGVCLVNEGLGGARGCNPTSGLAAGVLLGLLVFVTLVSPGAEDARCVVCDGPGDLRDLLFCTSCGQHYHGTCLDIALTPRKRSGWQCPECKVCQTCR